MIATPDEIRMEAEQIDAIAEAFESYYLHFIDIGEEEPEEREKGVAAFYALRNMIQGVIYKMHVLSEHMEVCDAVAAVAKLKGEEKNGRQE